MASWKPHIICAFRARQFETGFQAGITAALTGVRFSKPIIQVPDPDMKLLSFMNLVEIHVLDAIRRKHDIPLEKVRTAMNYLSKQFPSRHPLADQEFVTDGLNLFIKKFSQLINISQEGQLAIQEILQAHLHRIERDLKGIPVDSIRSRGNATSKKNPGPSLLIHKYPLADLCWQAPVFQRL